MKPLFLLTVPDGVLKFFQLICGSGILVCLHFADMPYSGKPLVVLLTKISLVCAATLTVCSILNLAEKHRDFPWLNLQLLLDLGLVFTSLITTYFCAKFAMDSGHYSGESYLCYGISLVCCGLQTANFAIEGLITFNR